MDLEQDAMLTAIGQMSMEEAKEKWASRWNEFVQSMSRWKSIHALMRLAHLNGAKQRLAAAVLNKQEKQSFLADVQTELKEINASIQALSNAAYAKMGELSEMRNRLAHGDPAAPTSGRGRKFYSDRIAEIIQLGTTRDGYMARYRKVEYVVNRAESLKSRAERDRIELTGERKAAEESLGAAKQRLSMAQDEYDITKPYAMGLLVADIFRSLAMAIQGEIY